MNEKKRMVRNQGLNNQEMAGFFSLVKRANKEQLSHMITEVNLECDRRESK